jgi:hypothetical protein
MKTHITLLAAFVALVPRIADAMDGIDPVDEEDPGTSEPSGPAPPPPPQPTVVKTLNHSLCFPDCSNDWGAGFSVNGRIAATPRAVTGTRDKLDGYGELDTYAKVNGHRYSLFRVRVTGVSEAKLRTDVNLTAYVAGAAVFTKPFVSVAGTYTWMNVGQSWPKTFFDKSVSLSVGPIPVTFRAKATGELGANLLGKITNVGFEVGANPLGKASLFASAAVGGQYCVDYVGCVGASAGLSVNVTLVEAAAPVNFNIWYSLVNMGWGAQLNYGLNSNITLKTLSGWLKVFASACLIGCLDWDRKLIDWAGWNASYGLLNINGKYCLAGDCGTVLGFQQ